MSVDSGKADSVLDPSPQSGKDSSLAWTKYVPYGGAEGSSSCAQHRTRRQADHAISAVHAARPLSEPDHGLVSDSHSVTKPVQFSLTLLEEPVPEEDALSELALHAPSPDWAAPLYTPLKLSPQARPHQLPQLRPLDLPPKPAPTDKELHRGLFLQLPTPSNALPDVFAVESPLTDPPLPPSNRTSKPPRGQGYVYRNLCKELFPDRMDK